MDDKNKSGGISFLELLTVAFIVLKLCGVINWSWVCVLMPVWLPIVLLLLYLVIVWSK